MATKPLFVEPIPEPRKVPVLRKLIQLADEDPKFEGYLVKSLKKAKEVASRDLDPALYKALPYGLDSEYHTKWPTTFEAYLTFLNTFSHWVPQQSTDDVWTSPGSAQGEHQEVYDHLCFFYWLVNQPVLPRRGVLQHYDWFEGWLDQYADLWGEVLDRPGSFNDDMLGIIQEVSPKYEVENSMIGDPPRPNNPSGWMSFNQFFARELNPGLRPIAHPHENRTITAPADCTYKQHYEIDENGKVPPIRIKGTHTYASIAQLLEGSQFADCFAGGHFVHMFLGPYSYHRFHTPVAGVVKECYPLSGQVYLQVAIGEKQFDAADSAKNGYEFQQARGVLTIDTTGSPAGDVGIVAVIPIGMCQVSGVNMTHEVGTACAKGDEFGYFTFGGSDIIVLTQKGTDPVYNPAFVPGTAYYSRYGTSIARVTPLAS